MTDPQKLWQGRVECDGLIPQLYAYLFEMRDYVANFRFPDTAVFERGWPTAMYLWEAPESSSTGGAVLRRYWGKDITEEKLLMHFSCINSVGKTQTSPVVAEFATYDGSNGGYSVEYLDADAAARFIQSRGGGGKTGVLQRFVRPKDANNTVMLAVWSRTATTVSARQNAARLDSRKSTTERCCTYDGPPALSMPCNPSTFLKRRVDAALSELVALVLATEDVRIESLVAYLKVSSRRSGTHLYLLRCTSIRTNTPPELLSDSLTLRRPLNVITEMSAATSSSLPTRDLLSVRLAATDTELARLMKESAMLSPAACRTQDASTTALPQKTPMESTDGDKTTTAEAIRKKEVSSLKRGLAIESTSADPLRDLPVDLLSKHRCELFDLLVDATYKSVAARADSLPERAPTESLTNLNSGPGGLTAQGLHYRFHLPRSLWQVFTPERLTKIKRLMMLGTEYFYDDDTGRRVEVWHFRAPRYWSQKEVLAVVAELFPPMIPPLLCPTRPLTDTELPQTDASQGRESQVADPLRESQILSSSSCRPTPRLSVVDESTRVSGFEMLSGDVDNEDVLSRRMSSSRRSGSNRRLSRGWRETSSASSISRVRFSSSPSNVVRGTEMRQPLTTARIKSPSSSSSSVSDESPAPKEAQRRHGVPQLLIRNHQDSIRRFPSLSKSCVVAPQPPQRTSGPRKPDAVEWHMESSFPKDGGRLNTTAARDAHSRAQEHILRNLTDGIGRGGRRHNVACEHLQRARMKSVPMFVRSRHAPVKDSPSSVDGGALLEAPPPEYLDRWLST